MKNVVPAAAFVIVELFLFLFREVTETLLNRYFAVNQMAIDTGFLYENAIRMTDFTWGIAAIASAAAYAAYIFIFKESRE